MFFLLYLCSFLSFFSSFLYAIRQRRDSITLFAIHLYNLIVFLHANSYALIEARSVFWISRIFFFSLSLSLFSVDHRLEFESRQPVRGYAEQRMGV